MMRFSESRVHHPHFDFCASIMAQVRFDKAVEIVQNLPKGGPIQPSQDQQLNVGLMISFTQSLTDQCPTTVLQVLQARFAAFWLSR